jgi:hypothetical protein
MPTVFGRRIFIVVSKKGNKKRNPRKPDRRVLTHTPTGGWEWRIPEMQDKEIVEHVFNRVLGRFGWSRNADGRLEHTGFPASQVDSKKQEKEKTA